MMMNNGKYKIRVNNEAESREAQELFFELGYAWHSGKHYLKLVSGYTHLTVYPDGTLTMGFGDAEKELTLPQLRDLVVLHRNDVSDATHQDRYNAALKYAYLNNEWYEYLDGWKSGWVNTIRVIPIDKSEDIQSSGSCEEARFTKKDALKALSDGKDVQYCGYDKIWRDDIHLLKIYEFSNGSYLFRLKPKTVKLNGEYSKEDLLNIISEKFKAGAV